MKAEKLAFDPALKAVSERELGRFGYKRVVHGGSAWSSAASASPLHQPQDGAQESGSLYTAMTRKAFREPEDATLTGGTRSLMRRVMGLNVTALAAVRKPMPRGVAPKSQAQVA